MMPKGRWVPCDPAWVAQYNACGETVRRPVVEPCDIPQEQEAGGTDHFHMTGHEHLMIVFRYSGHTVPMPHESGEPA